MRNLLVWAALLMAMPPGIRAQPGKTTFHFHFGSGMHELFQTQVLPATVYAKDLGYGFDLASRVSCGERSCTSDKPFFFSVALPEGNYNVTLTLGDAAAESVTTVKAESRRLMLEKVKTAPGEFATRVFTVNIRTPAIASGGQVKLKDREVGVLHWDDKLTLEFNDARPSIAALEVTPAASATTLYIMGDSTVTDQTKEPWNSWGQMLPRFFKAGVAVANHAESGESLKSSQGARRLDKVMSTIKTGDYLFIQFGHNDQKEKGEGVGAFTTYKASLKHYVAEARKRGAIPVLITPVNRRTFDDDGKITNSLGDYPEAVRQAAREENVALIDLNAMSKLFNEALGPENSKKAFVDNTHHNNYGSYELAKCVVEGIKANKLGIAKFLVDGVPAFAADRPWQELSMPSAAEAASKFAAPPAENGMVLWWGWDGPMSEEVVVRDLDAIKARGFPCVMIEAGYGMKAPYLSQGWFELVRFAVDEARKRGMCVWVEDEGKYPSGFAGGKFSAERPDLRMQALVVGEKIPLAGGETLVRKLPPEALGAIAVNAADNNSQALAIRDGELNWKAPEGKSQVLIVRHDFRTSQTRSVNNPTRGKDTTNSLCDYLDPEATRQFVAWTHEQYKKYVGHEFGRTFMGFMGDEPDFAYTPWTPKIFGEFEKRKGYDVRPHLASFFAPKLSDDARRAKADYWDVWSDLFAENFFDVQAEWCRRNNLEYIVHLNHEDMMMGLVRSEGDYFKAMRNVGVPGVDAIWLQIWPGTVADYPKLASSAAHLFGKPRAFTESFAAYKIRPNVEQAKWVLDYQLVRGINMVQIMFQPSSANGVRPPSGFMGSEQFPALARYVNRATYVLSLGRPAARIGVYHPTSSMWLGDEEANKSTLALSQKLLENQRDFDFVDEQALSSLLTLGKGTFRTLSGNEYGTILVPGATVMSSASLDRLRAFAKSRGRVVFLGRTPSLIAGQSILKAGAPGDFGWALVESAVDLTPQVLKALPPPDVALDPAVPAVKYVHRRWRDAEVYFFFNESDERVVRKATLAGSGAVQLWDAATGKIAPIPGAAGQKGAVSIALELGPGETKLIVAGASAAAR